MGLIDNKLVLVQVMAWHVVGDKPQPKSMMTKFNDRLMLPVEVWVRVGVNGLNRSIKIKQDPAKSQSS